MPSAARLAATIAGAAALVPASLALAHHSVLPYDNARGVTLEGTVAETVWQNPHTYIYVDVPGGAGAVQRWTVESEGATVLRRLGWQPESLAAATHVKVVGAPARDGSRALRCKHIELANGQALPCFPASLGANHGFRRSGLRAAPAAPLHPRPPGSLP